MSELLRTARELGAFARKGRCGVVMTMGALHEGHATLIRAAREHVGADGTVLVTVFVNPLQFGVGEDLDRYPRTLEEDLRIAAESGADAVFAPTVDEVYPGGSPRVRLAAGPMGECLEGATRPGHFDGMLTVVAKLLHLTGPDLAFFGQKDAQQLALVRRMVLDLNFPVRIVGVPTVREDDGLALSSRNRFLSAEERAAALALSAALFAGAAKTSPAAVREAAHRVLEEAPGLDVDYLALVDPADFTEVADDHRGDAVLAVAAKSGATRLIDNLPLTFDDPARPPHPDAVRRQHPDDARRHPHSDAHPAHTDAVRRQHTDDAHPAHTDDVPRHQPTPGAAQ